MADWQQLCLACKNGHHEGGCCGCSVCRVAPEPVVPLTRADVEAKIIQKRADQQRAPQAFQASYSAQLDDLLEDWRAAVLEEAIAETSAD
jgi:hypothetical protein